eukprot:GHVH01008332.1.p1 GENE.GHVH01008332.1~~GHVH01008332.1.p1  ORF type:complete len:170 (+),score=12.31 GHVH01008332.1:28-510(+)
MPFVRIFVNVDSENVAELRTRSDHTWNIDIEDSTDPQTTRKGITLSANDEVMVPNSRTTANFVCKMSGNKACQINVVPHCGEITKLAPDEDCELVVMETRGVNITNVNLGSGFDVVSCSGTVFKDVDLSEEWCAYDENASVPVSIMSVATKLVCVKDLKH